MWLTMTRNVIGTCAGILATGGLRTWVSARRGRRAAGGRCGWSVGVMGLAAVLGVLGAVLFALGLILSGVPPIAEAGTVLGEPCLALGAVLLVAGWSVAGSGGVLDEEGRHELLRAVSRFAVVMGPLIFSASMVVVRFGVAGVGLRRPVRGIAFGQGWARELFFGLLSLGCLVATA